jgi:hypothetical protein
LDLRVLVWFDPAEQPIEQRNGGAGFVFSFFFRCAPSISSIFLGEHAKVYLWHLRLGHPYSRIMHSLVSLADSSLSTNSFFSKSSLTKTFFFFQFF